MKATMDRRDVLQMAAVLAVARSPTQPSWTAPSSNEAGACGEVVSLERVPFPRTVSFKVRHGDNAPVTLYGHYWYDVER
jgi:hypothetical protein